MAVRITVRDVPDGVRGELAVRAARAEVTAGVRPGDLVEAGSRPPVGDVIARARARVDVTDARADASAILTARDADRR